ncbi:diflavin oxidoreductase [Roseibacillus ishigakijimensis]|uniref:assimilatory sulfite reductase (NADPH) n=1 Tax=Roseibacillus ishigakijimensis TaxID=454146 RepID=A0A934RPZ1_9BACT|nr:flavodoxin domain-containing protein [Roseibacillus ishigakijimensis]MBK1833456.1 flavodoxin domain-containing protein [Roseibacillus ishigakijimensis]
MAGPLFVPENAPFSPEQRAWLNDFFAKQLAAGGGAPAADSGPAVPVTILWGSQTGNAEGCAKRMAKALSGGRFEPQVFDLADYEVAKLAQEKNVLLITSTYGDGEPPDNAADFVETLLSDEAPKMEGVKFSVLALGDSEYPDFCETGKVIDQRFGELGGERIYDRVDCDVDYDEPFDVWKKGIIDVLGAGSAVAELAEIPAEDIPYGKSKPFPAPILNNYDLNKEGAFKSTHHLEFSLEGSDMEYEVGDALGVVPVNPEDVVDEILAALPFNTNREVPLPGGGEAPLREALLHHYDIRSLNKNLLTEWSSRSGSPYLRSVVETEDKAVLDDFCWGRELIDLVVDYPADFRDGEELVGVLKKLQPRLYSISSSPKAHPGEVHLTVAVVDYQSYGRVRGGVCSTFLARRSEGLQPGVYVHTNKAFRPPADKEAPMIMVGPGTGVAPFRAFLEEREATGAKGKNWLFFGNPYRATDFLYEEELAAKQESGVLNKLSLAFSRDQKEKLYVQHLMLQEGEELWKWLDEGAYFYVCGDASRMAKDVDAALHQVVQTYGGKSEEEAIDFVKQLKKDKRYARDVY